jgi:hypothetical protein
MVMFMFFAFFCAGNADIRANLANRVRMIAFEIHDLNSSAADGGAFQVQPDAGDHFVCIRLLHTACCTLLTGNFTLRACLDTGLIFVKHSFSFLFSENQTHFL